ncbi:hypothetical protein BT69DRAFT_606190 [Atractiella rhizophila]|nr:hypothetical protein BT69DRAFT_606190 [Atractiella rhizophila]
MESKYLSIAERAKRRRKTDDSPVHPAESEQGRGEGVVGADLGLERDGMNNEISGNKARKGARKSVEVPVGLDVRENKRRRTGRL